MTDRSGSPARPTAVDRRRFLMATAGILGLTAIPVPHRASAEPAAGSGTAGSGAAGTPSWRPAVHFTPERNWMNDPNGLVHHDGEYHLFFQHNPNGKDHADLSWGHAVSRDLVQWQELDVALHPDELGEIFSGCAVVDHHDTSGFFGGAAGLVAIYTAAGDTQQQAIAYSTDHGRTWTKYSGNPVIPNPGVEDFRDPKVFWHDATARWIMALAAGDRILFYGSTDLRDWQLLGEFGADRAISGQVWECPDLFVLPVDGDPQDTRWVLVVSTVPGGPAGGSGTRYFLGEFDGETFYCADPVDRGRWVDHGADFYAAQSFSDIPAADGRRIWLGWMSNWDYAEDVPTDPWRGAMSVPRELGLTRSADGVSLVQNPVAEIARLRTGSRHWSGPVDAPVPEFFGDVVDIVAEFRLGGASRVGIEIFAGDRYRTRIGYDVTSAELSADRTESGSTPVASMFPGRHAVPLELDGDVLSLRIIADRSCVEVYGEQGSAVLTDLVLPDAGDRAIRIVADGPADVSVDVHDLA